MKIQLYGTVLVTTINAPKTIGTYDQGHLKTLLDRRVHVSQWVLTKYPIQCTKTVHSTSNTNIICIGLIDTPGCVNLPSSWFLKESFPRKYVPRSPIIIFVLDPWKVLGNTWLCKLAVLLVSQRIFSKKVCTKKSNRNICIGSLESSW